MSVPGFVGVLLVAGLTRPGFRAGSRNLFLLLRISLGPVKAARAPARIWPLTFSPAVAVPRGYGRGLELCALRQTALPETSTFPFVFVIVSVPLELGLGGPPVRSRPGDQRHWNDHHFSHSRSRAERLGLLA